jgi:ADP-ribosylglycohydrolase
MVEDPSTLVGQGVADALGMPFETRKPDDPFLVNWDGTYQASEYHQLRPGQWTDDTMMAKIVMESLYICGGFYPRDIAQRYQHWYLAGPLRGMGTTTKKAMQNLRAGMSWNESGVVGAEGNGTAMRAAPFGAFYQEDPLTAAQFSRMEANITHKSLEAEEGSAAVAVAVSLLWTGAEPQDIVTKTIEYLRESKVKLALSRLAFYQKTNDVSAIEALKLFGTKAHVVQTVPSAFAAFVLTSSYEEAVLTSIRSGGDTDTTAAIAGALAGTYYGFKSIPKKYREGLEDWEHLRRIESKINIGPRTSVLWRM